MIKLNLCNSGRIYASVYKNGNGLPVSIIKETMFGNGWLNSIHSDDYTRCSFAFGCWMYVHLGGYVTTP